MSRGVISRAIVLAVFSLITVGIIGLTYGFVGQAQAKGDGEGSFSKSTVWSWPPPAKAETVITGASSNLHRSENGVQYSFETLELAPGSYTMWFVVFNDTASCEGGCGGDDLMSGRGNSSAFWDMGTVVKDNRQQVKFVGQVNEGQVPTGLDQILQDNTGGKGMIDAETAEVHLVVRSHGSAVEDPQSRRMQLTTFSGACQPDEDSCVNVQYAVHLPPAE